MKKRNVSLRERPVPRIEKQLNRILELTIAVPISDRRLGSWR